jgi:hypothetical protein
MQRKGECILACGRVSSLKRSISQPFFGSMTHYVESTHIVKLKEHAFHFAGPLPSLCSSCRTFSVFMPWLVTERGKKKKNPFRSFPESSPCPFLFLLSLRLLSNRSLLQCIVPSRIRMDSCSVCQMPRPYAARSVTDTLLLLYLLSLSASLLTLSCSETAPLPAMWHCDRPSGLISCSPLFPYCKWFP